MFSAATHTCALTYFKWAFPTPQCHHRPRQYTSITPLLHTYICCEEADSDRIREAMANNADTKSKAPLQQFLCRCGIPVLPTKRVYTTLLLSEASNLSELKRDLPATAGLHGT